MPLKSLHHVQLAMPAGQESRACDFYEGLLGIPEVAKPEALAGRGGVWFERDELRVHLGVEEPFLPAIKAHPAFETNELSKLQKKLEDAGYATQVDTLLAGYHRFYANDPFGNRIEFLQRVSAGS